MTAKDRALYILQEDATQAAKSMTLFLYERERVSYTFSMECQLTSTDTCLLMFSRAENIMSMFLITLWNSRTMGCSIACSSEVGTEDWILHWDIENAQGTMSYLEGQFTIIACTLIFYHWIEIMPGAQAVLLLVTWLSSVLSFSSTLFLEKNNNVQINDFISQSF